ncbi:hypothetical protein J6590_099449 [Homalodisca vitripennis]|nr:hypothetical protein J6590_099449 [Homalodisca vitripennis]
MDTTKRSLEPDLPKSKCCFVEGRSYSAVYNKGWREYPECVLPCKTLTSANISTGVGE